VDACHSASAFDLPFSYDFKNKVWVSEGSKKDSRLEDLKSTGFVILLSGCQDSETSGDTRVGGIFTTSFYNLVNSNDCSEWTLAAIIEKAIEDALKQKDTQHPNMSCSRKFDVNMKFKDLVNVK